MSIIKNIEHFFVKVKRSFDYAKHGFKSEDWAYDYLLQDIKFKLDRMWKLNKECTYIHPDDLKKMDDIYHELNFLLTNELEDVYSILPESMILDIDFIDIPNEDGTVSITIDRKYAEGVTEEKYRAALMEARNAKEKNLKKFFKVLSNNIRKLWN